MASKAHRRPDFPRGSSTAFHSWSSFRAVAVVVSGVAPDLGFLSCEDVGPLTGLWRGVVTSVARQEAHESTWLLDQRRQTPTEVWGDGLEVIPAHVLPPEQPSGLAPPEKGERPILDLSVQFDGSVEGEEVHLRVRRARAEVEGHLVDLSLDLASSGMVTIGSRIQMKIAPHRKTLQGEGESKHLGKFHLTLEKVVNLCSSPKATCPNPETRTSFPPPQEADWRVSLLE